MTDERLQRVAEDVKAIAYDLARAVTDELMEIEMAKPKWRPIETAPKDDTYVLVYCPDDFEWHVAAYRGRWETVWMDHRCESMEPTHWMPLPEPPNA